MNTPGNPVADDDATLALYELAGRSGATATEVGYLYDGVPVDEADWWAEVQWGTKCMRTDYHPSPAAAALTLATKLLTGSLCKCGRHITLEPQPDRCHWTLNGRRWASGCDDPPMLFEGTPGDITAMQTVADKRARERATTQDGTQC